MPEIGDIITGKELGYTGGHTKYRRYFWCVCPMCYKGFWRRDDSPAKTGRCAKCAASETRKLARGEKNPRWKGGRIIAQATVTNRYMKIKLEPDDPFYSMAKLTGGYCYEHRLVMARHLNRCLTSKEYVHHVNGVGDDNRIENLILTDNRIHPRSYNDGYLAGYREASNQRDKQLEMQIKLLRWQIKELREQLQGRLGKEVSEGEQQNIIRFDSWG
jgi:hypothetical protein